MDRMDTHLIVAIVLTAVAIALLVSEFFVPTGGIFAVGSLTLFAIAVGVVWYWGTSTEATVAVIGFCVGMPAAGWGLMQAWKTLAIRRGLDPDAAGGSITQAVPELSELEKLRGQTGKTVSPMRPAGVVLLGGRRVDAITEGMMLDPDVWVRCVDVKAGRVIVRRTEQASHLNEIDLELR
jgi:membrane-bound serine protease (ClpP class)